MLVDSDSSYSASISIPVAHAVDIPSEPVVYLERCADGPLATFSSAVAVNRWPTVTPRDSSPSTPCLPTHLCRAEGFKSSNDSAEELSIQVMAQVAGRTKQLPGYQVILNSGDDGGDSSSFKLFYAYGGRESPGSSSSPSDEGARESGAHSMLTSRLTPAWTWAR